MAFAGKGNTGKVKEKLDHVLIIGVGAFSLLLEWNCIKSVQYSTPMRSKLNF